jgi:hypothetical protein
MAAHLAACAECRAEVERCRALATLVAGAEVAPSPHPAQLATLLRRIDESEGARQRPGLRTNLRNNLRTNLVRLFGSGRVSVAWALAAQAATLVLLLGVIFWPSAPEAPDEAAPSAVAASPAATGDYRTLSSAPAPATPAATAHQVRVVFAAGTTEVELRRVLLELRGEMVGGPSPLGTYVVAVPRAEPLQLVLEHLRADPRVRFAEPVAGGGVD